MTKAEFCGLTLKDIDLEKRTINVNHQLQYVGNRGKYIEKTKTEAGTRVLPMSDEVYAAFKRVVQNRKKLDCQHFFRQIFLGYFSDIVQAFDTLRKNVCGDDYTSLHNPIVLSSVLPAYGMFHSIQILFL